ncbi:MAG TPA: hypothetical protein VFT99_00170, partial [Roseiflexaceae bacterium]|nr:hypothetical protein [Roseiflexaceae bacterium]
MTKNRYPFVLCIVLLAGLMGTWAAQGVQAQASTGIVRVAPSGSNAAGCGSASNPCQTLQFAVEQLISGSGASRAINGEVRIAAGTYTEGNPAFENIIGIGLPGNLTIRGGYTTSNWNSSSPTNATILDGQGSRRGILITVPEAQAAGCAMRVENLSITNGRSSAAEPSGGGILINNCSGVTVSNVSVRNSIAAGQNNTGNIGLSPGTGGGIAVRGTTNVRAGLTLQNVTLANNQALGGDEGNFARGGLGSGGGLYGINAAVVANGLTVSNNSASAGDAPAGSGEDGVQRADGLGGGIGLIQSTFSIANATIGQNHAQGGNAAGKGGLGLGGGLFIEISSGTLQDVTVSSNSAQGANGNEAGPGLGGGVF